MKQTWTDERTDQLIAIVGDVEVVSKDVVEQAAEELEVTNKSIAAKLRKLGFGVESLAKARKPTFTDEEEQELIEFVENNENAYTAKEVAAYLYNDETRSRQVQGKLLSLDMVSMLKKAEHKEAEKVYTDEETNKLIDLVSKHEYIEDIADAMGKEEKSVRGKLLSLSNKGLIPSIPKKKNRVAAKQDPLEALGDVSEMTVAEIAASIEKTERGVKTMLTHRGIDAQDYKGATKKAKIEEKKAA